MLTAPPTVDGATRREFLALLTAAGHGVLLGREDAAAEVVRTWTDTLAAGRAAHPLDGRTLGLVSVGCAEGFVDVFGPESSIARRSATRSTPWAGPGRRRTSPGPA